MRTHCGCRGQRRSRYRTQIRARAPADRRIMSGRAAHALMFFDDHSRSVAISFRQRAMASFSSQMHTVDLLPFTVTFQVLDVNFYHFPSTRRALINDCCAVGTCSSLIRRDLTRMHARELLASSLSQRVYHEKKCTKVSLDIRVR